MPSNFVLAPTGPEFRINASTPGAQTSPQIATLKNGGFVVSWLSQTEGNTQYTVYAQRYSNNGAPLGEQFRVDTTDTGFEVEPTVAALEDGGFLVSWSYYNTLSGSYDVHARRYAVDGTAFGNEFLVNTAVVDDQRTSSVTALLDGGFVVSWTSGYYDVFAQRYAADGAKIAGEFRINGSSSSLNAEIASLTGGGFVASWWSLTGNDIYARSFTVDGIATGASFLVNSTTSGNQRGPSVAGLTGGGYVVSWTSADTGSDLNIYAQRYNAQGAAQGGEFCINTTTAGAQQDAALISLSNGGFAISWTSYPNNLVGGGIFIQRYDSNGLPIGSEFSVNGTAAYGQFDSELAEIADGSLVVIWTLALEPIDIYAQRFASPTQNFNPLVNNAFYLARYSDVAASGVEPDAHYAEFGWREGRDPNAFFSTSGYLAANADVKSANINPLEHYKIFGWREGRDPSSIFDSEIYLARNPDVATAALNPLLHFLAFGQAESRNFSPAIGKSIVDGFDAHFYIMSNPDVVAANTDPLQHYRSFGAREGRDPNGYFDSSAYLAANADVAAAGLNLLEHWLVFGFGEGRSAGPEFNARAYLMAYADVAVSGQNPLEHFLRFGAREGRDPTPDLVL